MNKLASLTLFLTGIAAICSMTTSSALAEEVINKITVIDTPVDAQGDPSSDVLKAALELIKCVEEAEGNAGGAQDPNAYDRLKDLLDDGKLKTIPPPNRGGKVATGVHDSENVATSTGEIVAYAPFTFTAVIAPRSAESVAATLTHELRHKENCSPGDPGDPTTDPDVVGQTAGPLAHANQHLDDLEYLCIVQSHWAACGAGEEFDCTIFKDKINVTGGMILYIERILRNPEATVTIRLRLDVLVEAWIDGGIACGCTGAEVNAD